MIFGTMEIVIILAILAIFTVVAAAIVGVIVFANANSKHSDRDAKPK